MGIDDVAAFAAPVKREPRVTITSTLRRTRSAASSGSSGVASTSRNSIRCSRPRSSRAPAGPAGRLATDDVPPSPRLRSSGYRCGTPSPPAAPPAPGAGARAAAHPQDARPRARGGRAMKALADHDPADWRNCSLCRHYIEAQDADLRRPTATVGGGPPAARCGGHRVSLLSPGRAGAPNWPSAASGLMRACRADKDDPSRQGALTTRQRHESCQRSRVGYGEEILVHTIAPLV
jgi:hypothetical protein